MIGMGAREADPTKAGRLPEAEQTIEYYLITIYFFGGAQIVLHPLSNQMRASEFLDEALGLLLGIEAMQAR